MRMSVSNINSRQTASIQQSYPLHYLLLGHSLPEHGFRQRIFLSGRDPHLSRVLRRVSLSVHDSASMQLV
jgi:hypothetical protein